MLVPHKRYECNKCGSVVSGNLLKESKIDINTDAKCPFCREESAIYNIACTNKLIGVFDHFNSTSWGNIADAVFVEDNGITYPRLVVRLRYGYMCHWNLDKSRLPYGFRIASPFKSRYKAKPVEFMYELKKSAAMNDVDIMDEIDKAIKALHKWITRFLI